MLSLLLITTYGCWVRHVELVGGSLGITLNGRGEIRRLIDIESGRNNHLRTAMIGEELVQYGAVSTEAPWCLQC